MGLAKKNGDPKAKQGKGRSIRSYWMTGVAGLLMLVAAAWYANWFQSQKATLAEQKTGVRVMAQVIAGAYSDLVKQQAALVGELARQPRIIDLFAAGRSPEWQVEQRHLTNLIPGALIVRLLPPDSSIPDTLQSPNMGYASLQLLRQAEQSQQLPPTELHQFGTPNQHIAIAAAVRDSTGKVLGVLHVALPTQGLGKLLDSVDQLAGRLEWQQIVPGKSSLVIMSNGSAARGAQPDGVLPIPGSIWQIAYWGGSAQQIDPLQLGMEVAPGVLLFLLMALLMMRLSAQTTKALKKDQHSILTLIESLIAGRLPKSQTAQLSDLQPTLDVMEHQIREFRSKQADKTKAQRVVQESEEADTGILVDEELYDEVENRKPATKSRSVEIAPSIFRAYDIRGVVGETLTEDVVSLLGQGFGSEIYERGFNTVVVGRDARNSSESLQRALIEGLQASGRDVVDLGLVPTPLVHFAAHELNAECGAMITGSHNPPQYNGMKMIVGGDSPGTDDIQELRRRIDADQLLQAEGSFDSRDIVADYIERVLSDVRLGQSLKIVVDCGNGAASVVAPELYRQLGCEVIELYCDVDGDFPNHHPDPGDPRNMRDLQKAVVEHEAALGLAFDGDGDRLGVVDSSGKIIWPDRLLMYLAIDVLTREPGGDIIYDVKCTRHLANIVLSNGGRPLMWKSGHSMLKAKMKETHALLAGEFSGHIIFAERWYGFDDGIYAGARLLEILSLDYRTSAEVFAELPESLSTPEFSLRLEEGHAQKVMQAIDQMPDLPGARMVKIDGVRAEFEKGWGLVRASNTIPALLFRFEAETEDDLKQVQSQFQELLKKADPQLEAPF
ncbi:MAG: phosphomannomutase/phosphoglucomutase [Candidatus Thiodiazotropha sp.]